MASSERDERRRSAFGEYVKSVVAERFVFVDECSTNTSLAARCMPQGAKRAPSAGQSSQELGQERLARVRHRLGRGHKASMSVEGSVDGKAFEGYVEGFLTPKLRRGQIVVMDNLSVHKSKRVRCLIEKTGATLLFLPAYSPDFNPIEEIFSKVKGILRKTAARTGEALVQATGHALDAISREDIRGCYADCGYRLSVQSL